MAETVVKDGEMPRDGLKVIIWERRREREEKSID